MTIEILLDEDDEDDDDDDDESVESVLSKRLFVDCFSAANVFIKLMASFSTIEEFEDNDDDLVSRDNGSLDKDENDEDDNDDELSKVGKFKLH